MGFGFGERTRIWVNFISRQAFSPSEGNGGVPVDLQEANMSSLLFTAPRVSVCHSPRLE